jgi:tape measure domain-containing protein
MAARRLIALVITADGRQAESTFKKLGGDVKGFASESEQSGERTKRSFKSTWETMDRAAAQSIREVRQLMRSMGASNINDLQRMLSQESRLLSDAGREQVRINQQTGKATHAVHTAELKEVQKSAREQVQIAERTARESAGSYEKHLGAGFFRSLASKSANAFKMGISTLTGGTGVGGGSGGFLPGLTNISEIIQGIPQIGQLAGALVRPLTSAAEAGVKFNAFLETSKIGFTTLLGSEEKAVAHLAELQRFANTTPFQFEDLVGASQRMQAFGFSARDIIPTLTAVGDAVSSTGSISKETLDGVLLALGQIKTKGKVSAEEMNQLAERGIPAWDLLAKAIGKTVAQTQKLATAGQLNGGAAVQAIAAQMEAKYGGQMARVSNTFTGRMSNLEDIRQQAQGKATENLTRDISETVGAALQRGDVASSLAATINMAISPVSGLIKTAAVGLLGGSITSGLTEGIAAGKGAVLNAAMDLGLGSIEALATSIGAHSPAVKFIELGEFAGQGFEIGLMNSTRRAFINFDKLTKEQLENARKIIEVGKQMGAPEKHVRAAISTGIVESRMRNLSYGDADSHGVFQQRPLKEWGSTVAGTMDVANAARMFYEHAAKYDRSGMSAGELAARVQRPRKDLRGLYGDALPAADNIIGRLVGGGNALPVRVVGGDMGAPTAADNAYMRNKMLVRPRQREDYGGRDPFVKPEWTTSNSTGGGFVDRYDKETGIGALAPPVANLLASIQQIDGLLPYIPRVFDESARAAEKAHLTTSYILDDVEKTGVAGNAVADSFNKADQAAGAWADRVIKGGNKANDIFKELSKNSEQVLVGALTNAKGGIMGIFHDIGAGWWQMLKQMVAQAISTNLNKALFGDTSKEGSGDGGHGLIGSIIGGLGGLLKGGKKSGGTSSSTVFADSPIPAAMTPEVISALTGKGNGGGRVGGSFGFGLPTGSVLKDLINSPAIAAASGVTSNIAILPSETLSGQIAAHSAASSATQKGLGSLFGSGQLLGGLGFGRTAGSGGALAAMLPLLGVQLGAGLGGGGLASIIGGAGGLLAGVGLSAAPAFLTTGTLGLASGPLGFLAPLFSNPFTIAAGGALLIGALIWGKNKARRKDEKARTQYITDAFAQIDELTRQVKIHRLDGGQALTQAAQIRAQYLQQSGALKDKKTRGIALKDVSRLDDPHIKALRNAANKAANETDRAAKFAPEFANGGIVGNLTQAELRQVLAMQRGYDMQLIKVKPGEKFLPPHEHARLLERGGIISGTDRGVDDTFMYAPTGSMILNRAQQAKPRIPQFAEGGVVGGGSASSSAQQSSAPTFAPQMQVTVMLGTKDTSEAVLEIMESDGGRAVTTKNVRVAVKKKEL